MGWSRRWTGCRSAWAAVTPPGIAGESGSGKSVTSLGILGLHEGTRTRISGEIWLDGEDLARMAPDSIRELHANKVAMIFQDPLSSLHPYYSVGDQIIEAYRIHNRVGKKAARPCDRDAGPGRHPAGGDPYRRLSAPVLRWHEAARDDRDGAVV